MIVAVRKFELLDYMTDPFNLVDWAHSFALVRRENSSLTTYWSESTKSS